MHTQPLYAECEAVGGGVAEELNRRGICLPSSSSLTAEDQEFVIARILEAHSLGARRAPVFSIGSRRTEACVLAR
jgi:dTDP-4-amino-4,6-dideoxygalactose transaminase